jgi:hypothetical protein
MLYFTPNYVEPTEINQTSKQKTEWEFAEIWVDTLISPPYIVMLVK